MNFPSSLLQNGRSELPKHKILLWHFMYMRHKPNVAWNVKKNIPDFSQIKIPSSKDESDKGEGQSLNWNAFSIPIWTRFEGPGSYLKGWGVVAYSVRSIRMTGDVIKKRSQSGVFVANGSLDIEHSPNPHNFSHCHLTITSRLSKAERREARMAIKHNSFVALYPNKGESIVSLTYWRAKMSLVRLLSRL